MSHSMPIYSAFFSGFILLAIVLLAFNVTRLRLREKTKGKGSEAMQAFARLHMNNFEFGVPFCLLLLFNELCHLAPMWLVLASCVFILARLLHGIGFVGSKKLHRQLHFAGAGLSYTVLILFALTLFVRALRAL